MNTEIRNIDNTLNALELRCGPLSKEVKTYLEGWMQHGFIDAVFDDENWEYQPESIETCHYQPEYNSDDDMFVKHWVGEGISLEGNELNGTLSHYDGDWDTEYFDLTCPDTARCFLESLKRIAEPFRKQDYLEWMMEKGCEADPLDYFNNPTHVKGDACLYVRKTTVGLVFWLMLMLLVKIKSIAA